MLYTIGNRLTDDMPHFLYLLANVHIFSDIYTTAGIYFISARISSSSGTVLPD